MIRSSNVNAPAVYDTHVSEGPSHRSLSVYFDESARHHE